MNRSLAETAWGPSHAISSTHLDDLTVSAALTPPAGATRVAIQAVTAPVFWTVDGTDADVEPAFEIAVGGIQTVIDTDLENINVYSETGTARVRWYK